MALALTFVCGRAEDEPRQFLRAWGCLTSCDEAYRSLYSLCSSLPSWTLEIVFPDRVWLQPPVACSEKVRDLRGDSINWSEFRVSVCVRFGAAGCAGSYKCAS